MSKTLKIAIILSVLIISIGSGVFVSVKLLDDKENNGDTVKNNYIHEQAVSTAIENGYASESLNDVKIGMTVNEVNQILGEEGVLSYESENTKTYVYSSLKNNYNLEIVFKNEKVDGISLLRNDN